MVLDIPTGDASTSRLTNDSACNLERAGMLRSVAMKLTGHKADSAYRRYAIADERDLPLAVERLDATVVAR